MAKKIYLQIPIEFDGVAIITDAEFIPAIDDAIKRGQMSLAIDLASINSPGSYFSWTAYPDSFNGKLAFERKDRQILVSAHGTHKMEFEDYMELPAKVVAGYVIDANADSYYFNEEEEGIDTDVTIEVPQGK